MISSNNPMPIPTALTAIGTNTLSAVSTSSFTGLSATHYILVFSCTRSAGNTIQMRVNDVGTNTYVNDYISGIGATLSGATGTNASSVMSDSGGTAATSFIAHILIGVNGLEVQSVIRYSGANRIQCTFNSSITDIQKISVLTGDATTLTGSMTLYKVI